MIEDGIGLLASVRRMLASETAVPYRDFQLLLDREQDKMPPNEWREIVEFASDQHAIKRRLKENEGRPLDRILSAIMSNAGILVGQVGLQSVAKRLYATALYPKGTVGRSGR